MARRLGIILLMAAPAFLAVAAYWLLFTTMMGYDDEGYVLVTLKNFSAHGGLYREVYSQYGPFLYFLYDLGQRIFGYEYTNNTGRFITMLCWIFSAGVSTHLVWRHTRSVALAGFTIGYTFFHLRLMVSEPIHPGGMIAGLVAGGAWLGTVQLTRGSMRLLAITSGLLGAALLLTKINVGVFYLIAAGTWFSVHLRKPNHSRVTTGIFSLGLMALPLGLMRSQLSDGPVLLFACLSIVACSTMLAMTWQERQPNTTWTDAFWGGAALLLFAGMVITFVCLRDTSLSEMLEGILLGPLRHPGIYHFPPGWKPGTVLAIVTSCLLAVLWWKRKSDWLVWVIIGLRAGLTMIFGLACMEWLPYTSHSITMSYLMPFAWTFAVRIAPGDSSPNPASWVGLILVLQMLHAYPVAGSQIAWGTFLIVPLMALGLHDAQRQLSGLKFSRYGSILVGSVLLLALASVGRFGSIGWNHYHESQPLHLPGAEDVRIPEPAASAIRIISLNASAHGDVLFSLPGMYSFNQWTDLPTPTLANTTHWFSLLNRQQQDEIAAALTRSDRPVIIVQRYILNFLRDTGFSVASPLYDYMQQQFFCAFSIEYYEFWVRRGRSVAAIGTAEIFQLQSPEPGVAPGKLELILAIPPGRQVARIEIVPLADPSRILTHWDKSTGPLFSQAINLQGTPVSDTLSEGWEQPLPSLCLLTLPLDPLKTFHRPKVVVHVRDKNGALLAEARFKD